MQVIRVAKGKRSTWLEREKRLFISPNGFDFIFSLEDRGDGILLNLNSDDRRKAVATPTPEGLLITRKPK